MRYVLMIGLLLSVIGCGSSYRFEQMKPASPDLSFSDAQTRWHFSFVSSDNGPGAKTRYDGIRFVLENISDDPITIDWNRVSFTDASGSAGGAVFHNGVKFSEASSPKAPTTIPPHSLTRDVFVPSAATMFLPGRTNWGLDPWVVDMLPDPDNVPDVDFGIYVTLSIGKEAKNYEFKFHGHSEAPPPQEGGAQKGRGAR